MQEIQKCKKANNPLVERPKLQIGIQLNPILIEKETNFLIIFGKAILITMHRKKLKTMQQFGNLCWRQLILLRNTMDLRAQFGTIKLHTKQNMEFTIILLLFVWLETLSQFVIRKSTKKQVKYLVNLYETDMWSTKHIGNLKIANEPQHNQQEVHLVKAVNLFSLSFRVTILIAVFRGCFRKLLYLLIFLSPKCLPVMIYVKLCYFHVLDVISHIRILRS